MKKIISTALILALAALFLTSCSGGATPISDIFAEIKAEVGFEDFNEFKSEDDLKKYYGITADQLDEFAGGINNTGVNQEEIVLVKASDADAAESIRQALDTRYQSKLNQNKNYNPEQARMIEACSVESDGLYVSMIVSENADRITQIYNNGIKN